MKRWQPSLFTLLSLWPGHWWVISGESRPVQKPYQKNSYIQWIMKRKLTEDPQGGIMNVSSSITPGLSWWWTQGVQKQEIVWYHPITSDTADESIYKLQTDVRCFRPTDKTCLLPQIWGAGKCEECLASPCEPSALTPPTPSLQLTHIQRHLAAVHHVVQSRLTLRAMAPPSERTGSRWWWCLNLYLVAGSEEAAIFIYADGPNSVIPDNVLHDP